MPRKTDGARDPPWLSSEASDEFTSERARTVAWGSEGPRLRGIGGIGINGVETNHLIMTALVQVKALTNLWEDLGENAMEIAATKVSRGEAILFKTFCVLQIRTASVACKSFGALHFFSLVDPLAKEDLFDVAMEPNEAKTMFFAKRGNPFVEFESAFFSKIGIDAIKDFLPLAWIKESIFLLQSNDGF